ncbi:hypothetical protein H6G98_17780 [Nostoc sp. FACHB-857]|nr:hypothetical protein [Nostoc sp. FACHB-857]
MGHGGVGRWEDGETNCNKSFPCSFPMPNAPCPIPYALCPIPNAQISMFS